MATPVVEAQPRTPVIETPRLRAWLDPALGLVEVCFPERRLTFPRLLGVEIVAALGLAPRTLVEPGGDVEVVRRGEVVLAMYRPSPALPVECHARWRVREPGPLDLEISTLTPGQWSGLSVRTCSAPPAGAFQIVADCRYLAIHRPRAAPAVSYVEMCHPQDGIGVEVHGAELHFRLFGHDLEKGVILRGRLRGLLVDRDGDEAAARAAYAQFLDEPPRLSAY